MPSCKRARVTLLNLGGRDLGDPEVENERFTGEELRQRTDTYEDYEKFDISNFGDLGGRRGGGRDCDGFFRLRRETDKFRNISAMQAFSLT